MKFIYKEFIKILIDYMDCKICMEDEILIDLRVELKCGHDLCANCLDKLVLNQCPYCRRGIDNNKIEEDNNSDYYFLIEIPVTYVEYPVQKKKKKNKKRVKTFTSNRDRSEYERKSKKWKNEKVKECV